MAKVSTVIPAYNAADTLGRAIESVLAQSRAPYEIIVVNDGSTDETLAVAQRYGEHVRVLDVPHGGVSRARNHAIDVSSGEWIAFLDADDEWKPEKLAVQIARSDEHPEAMFVASGAEYQRNGGIYFTARPSGTSRQARELLLKNVINTCTVMVRREALESPRTRFTAGVRFGEDWELWITLAARYDVLLIPDVLVRTYRMPTNASSAVRGEEFGDAMTAMYDRLRTVPEVSALIEEMWPLLAANVQFQKANYLYDHGELRRARQILIGEVLKGHWPSLALAFKVTLLPLSLRNRINRLAAHRLKGADLRV